MRPGPLSFVPPILGSDAVYAALDLGTNNCRMLVARGSAHGFRVIDAFSRVTRLGEGLAETGELSEQAMRRTLDALRACVDRMARNQVTHARLVATEACRRAANCAQFTARVAAETGLMLDIIPAIEEAGLALAGCAPLLDLRVPWSLVFDIGGGSTELVWVRTGPRDRAVEGVHSIPLGVVTLAEQRGAELADADGYQRVVEDIQLALAPFEGRHAIAGQLVHGQVQMLGTSGTVTTLAALHLELDRYDRQAVDGVVLTFAEIAAITRRLFLMTPAERSAHPCIGIERGDLVMAGCAILEAVCRLWPLGRLRVADRGVREGVLIELMKARP